MEKKPIIFFDLETTGVDVVKDRIVQIATIKIFQNGHIEEKKYLVNPTVPIPLEASEVHGIYDKDVKDAPAFQSYSKNLLKYFEGCDIGGYNSNTFDIPILIEEFNRCGLELNTEGINFIDVLNLERQLKPMTLSEVYKRYMGKPLEDAHDALTDVRATVDIFQKQLENFEKETTLEEIDKFSQGDKERVDLAGKLCKIDDEICWSFGKYSGKPITTDVSYAQWFLRQSVPSETAKIILDTIKK